jgi:hypothetical protein
MELRHHALQDFHMHRTRFDKCQVKSMEIENPLGRKRMRAQVRSPGQLLYCCSRSRTPRQQDILIALSLQLDMQVMQSLFVPRGISRAPE